MASTPTGVLECQEELDFNQVLIDSLDPQSDDYLQSKLELENSRAQLQATMDALCAQEQSHSQSQTAAPSSHQNLNSSFDENRDLWWHAALNGGPGSGDGSHGSSTSNHFLPATSASWDAPFAMQGNKRPRPQSSYLDAYEQASKRPTPDPSNAGTPNSTGSLEHTERNDSTDRLRRNQLAVEAALRRRQEEMQRDAAFARALSQPRPSSYASSSRPPVQSTINYNGGFERPPPPAMKSDGSNMQQHSPFPPPGSSMLGYPSRPSFPTPQLDQRHIKAEPLPFRQTQQLPQRPREPPATIDLTGSDSEDHDILEIEPERYPPAQRQAQTQIPQQRQMQPPAYQMPGSYPTAQQSSNQYGYGSTDSPMPIAGPSGYSMNQVGQGFGNLVQRMGSHVNQLQDLFSGNTFSHPYDLDDDDDSDDDLIFQGVRRYPGFGTYAGHEDLYRSRFDAYAQYDPSRSKEEIEALLNNIRPDEELPAHLRVQTPDSMSVKLHKYQEMGLTWLKQAEEGTNKGGILADDMGLGKTIQMLALMVTRKSDDPRCKTTLIVAPVALMRQWRSEIKEKLKGGRHALTVFTHHATHKAKSFDQLRAYDVVLTTYGSIASELKKMERYRLRRVGNPDAVPTAAEKTLFLGEDANWYRVILDEAQCIKNKTTQTAKGACLLRAKYRFCVTGTPMMNSVEELFSLVHFLKIKPYSQWEKFRFDFNTPLRSPNEAVRAQAMRKFQALCKAIMLRRTKKSEFEGKPILILPERRTEIENPVFNEDEQAFYTALESRTALQFNRYVRAGTVGKSYSAILVLLLRLRQACCHPHLIKNFGVAVAADMSEDQMLEFAKQLDGPVVERIKATGGNFECPVCYDVTPNPAIFIPCGHDTCSECFTRIADPANALQQGDESGHVRCPNCRGNVDPKRLTDFNSFKRVHMPELLTGEERKALDAEDEPLSDSDEEDDDNSDDSSTMDESEDDDGSDLKDFIVDDDVVDEAGDTDDDELDANTSKVKKENPFGEEPSTSQPNLPAEGVAGPLDAFLSTAEGKKGKSKKSKDRLECKRVKGKGKGKGKSKGKGKGKEKEKKKKTKPSVTLAELKKQATRNRAAKERYLRRLRKDWISSAKIEKTMELLKGIMSSEEGEKVLVFSQWTSLLDLLEIPIHGEEYGYRRYDGSMTATMRGDAVDDFKDPSKNVRIMLVSLKAGNAGLNLNMASQVIILDPFWNPYIEEQAIDRAHRIGQTREVVVHRVLLENTVEDRIIALQEKKRALISEALDEKASQSLSRLGLNELAYLFGVNGNPSANYNPAVVMRTG